EFGQGDNKGEWRGYGRMVRLNLTGIRVKELNPFDPELNLVPSQILEGKECE
ncbi:hypothetical protein ALC56_13086, partial [Trachymyrmex septentrionalis]